MATLSSFFNETLETNKDRIECFEKVLENINDENVYLNELFEQYTQELNAVTSAKR